MSYLSSLVMVAGVAIAIQATVNAKLGVLLNSSMIATSIALFFVVFAVSAVVFLTKNYSQMAESKSGPLYLRFSGRIFSVVGAGIFYYLFHNR